VIEGSVVYGVRVPAKDKDRATAILKADAAERGYWIGFADGSRPPRKVDLQAKARWEKALAHVKPGMDRQQLMNLLESLEVMGGSSESQTQAGDDGVKRRAQFRFRWSPKGGIVEEGGEVLGRSVAVARGP